MATLSKRCITKRIRDCILFCCINVYASFLSAAMAQTTPAPTVDSAHFPVPNTTMPYSFPTIPNSSFILSQGANLNLYTARGVTQPGSLMYYPFFFPPCPSNFTLFGIVNLKNIIGLTCNPRNYNIYFQQATSTSPGYAQLNLVTYKLSGTCATNTQYITINYSVYCVPCSWYQLYFAFNISGFPQFMPNAPVMSPNTTSPASPNFNTGIGCT